MKHLSGLDALFLYLETPETPMHVGSLNLYDLPEGYAGDFYEDVKKHVASRMHLAPVFQRKLALMPFELANPVWVDDDDVDLDYHVRRIVLPKPGTLEQLEAYVGRLHSSLLDRSRPLWEFYVIEGLRTGQVAFYSKVHHAAIDGASGVAVANAILDTSAQPRQVKPPRNRRRRGESTLGIAELAFAGLTNTTMQYAKLAWYLPKGIKTLVANLLPKSDADGKIRLGILGGLSFGPKTSLNTSITNQRTYATASLPLAEVKHVAKRLDVSLNDVVLALCSGALRRYFDDENPFAPSLPTKPMTAAVPVSLREAGTTSLDNQVSMMLCNLATDIANPLKRLRSIHDSMTSAKKSFGNLKAVIPTDFPSLGAPWLMSGLASLYGRSKLADAIPPIANLVISNVPGPQFPLYLAGAKMATYWPVSIVVHGLALNVTVQSYNGSLDFGLTACRRAMPDVHDFVTHLRESLDEFKAVVAKLDKEQEARGIEEDAKREDKEKPKAGEGEKRRKLAAAPGKTKGEKPVVRLASLAAKNVR